MFWGAGTFSFGFYERRALGWQWFICDLVAGVLVRLGLQKP